MLRSLEIRDMLIIDQLGLGFQPGLNALTGETGAGKSILLDSLGFVLGWRGRAGLVREGAEQGEVTAVFDLPDSHPCHAVLDEFGIPAEDGDLILRRVNMPDGRKTAWVNDRRCSGEVLRRLSESLVELHGQHDDRGLLNARGHLELLDDYAKTAGQRARVARAWAAQREAQKALDETRSKLDAVRDEEDYLRHAVAEIEELDPQPGEEAELDTARRRMQAAERLRDDVVRAGQALSGDKGAEMTAADALKWLDGVSADADGLFDATIETLGQALNALAEASEGISRGLEALEFDAHTLENCEERLFALRALARKHGIVPENLSQFGGELRQRLDALDQGGEDLLALEAAVSEAQAKYEEAADKLSEKRHRAARALDKAVMSELAPLKMERAQFVTEITPSKPGSNGRDTVQFTVATNPGAPAGPLGKIASGGELSRFLLALKVCLAGDTTGMTLIFDEIDRGVGGATADAVGRRLSALAEQNQVLVVTHSPQVAALADHHWRVEKRVEKGTTISSVVPLSQQERVDEIARMLSGDTVTEEARAAADRLMD
ncbi:MAG: DNA repair protein RecN [Rhodobacterales bacterium]|nr:MAG: DNA repair protein RecN [Rhodobacterales bacterium]